MSVFEHPDFDAHEHVSFFHDPQTGLRSIIAIHRTLMGTAGGGCRMWPYPDDDAALRDVLRLSKAMTYKMTLAELPAGGAKSVIIGDPKHDKSDALFQAMGRAVERLAGRYIMAEDVGTTPQDMRAAAKESQYVVGQTQDTSPATGHGVFIGLNVAVKKRLKRDNLDGLRVAIQGLGGVGWSLATLLHEQGAKLIVADLNGEACSKASDAFDAQVVPAERIAEQDAEVFAPCALGGVLNAQTVPKLRCQVIAGGANNQLEDDATAQALAQRDILYAPDFVLNAGGVIGAAYYMLTPETDVSQTALLEKVAKVGDLLETVFERAERENTSTHAAAVAWAKEKMNS